MAGPFPLMDFMSANLDQPKLYAKTVDQMNKRMTLFDMN